MNGNNPENSIPLITTAEPSNTPQPDLVVSDISVSLEAISGTAIQAVWTITNQGDGPAWGSFAQVYLSEDHQVGEDIYLGRFFFNNTIWAGQEVTQQQSIYLPIDLEGDYRLIITTNVKDYLWWEESNEDNNTTVDDGLVAITIPSLDLVVSNIQVDSTAFSGTDLEIVWTVTNQGEAPTTGYWYDHVYLSEDDQVGEDTYLGNFYFDDTIAPGESVTRRQFVYLPDGWEGESYLILATDADNNIFEHENEDNNFAVDDNPVTVTIPSLDLVVSDIQVDSTAFSGSDIKVVWTVTNQGEAPITGPWYDHVYLSEDDRVGEDTYLGNFYFNDTIAPGESVTRRQSVRLPLDWEGESYFILATDADNYILEPENEDNNVAVDDNPVTVTIPLLPDLVVNDIQVDSTAFSGSNIQVVWTVTNQGDAPTSGYWYDRVYLSEDHRVGEDTYLGNFYFDDTIAPGESVTRRQFVYLPDGWEGESYFIVATDTYNHIFEHENEDNNTAVDDNPVTVTIPLLPDLVVNDIQVDATAFSGTDLEIVWTVTNQGDAPTTGYWYDRVYLSEDHQVGEDTYLGNFYFNDTIAPGESVTRRQSVRLPLDWEGESYLIVTTDNDNSLFEQENEDNNTTVDDNPVTVTTPPLPDLVVSDIQVDETAFSGSNIQVVWTVTNQGDGTHSWRNLRDAVYISHDQQVGDDYFAGSVYSYDIIPAGESETRDISISLPDGWEGDYYVIVTTDMDKRLREGTESNNTTVDDNPVTVTIPPLPDLVVSDIQVDLTAFSGSDIEVVWTVTNQGDAPTTGRWWDSVYLSEDDQVGADTSLDRFYFTGTLAAGESVTRKESVRLPNGWEGESYFIVTTDNFNSLFEHSNDSNNTTVDDQSITVTVPPQPDLVVSNIQVDATVFSGDNFDFEVVWTVTNQGDVPATGRWFDNIYLSHDDQLSPDDYSGDYRDEYYDPFSFYFYDTIAPGESVTRRESISLPNGWEGEYYVIVGTDTYNKVFEHDNEDNNLTVADQLLTVSIPPTPDLVVSDIQVPTTAFSGTDIEVVWTITNQGDGPTTGTWSDNLYLSEDGVRTDYSMGSFYFYGTLAAGESLTRRESVSLRNDWEGDYYLTVVTDTYNHQFEHDQEDNNTTVDHELLTITLPPRSDLVVSDITVPLETFSNQDLEIVWVVTNQGDEEATGTWNDLVYLSPDDRVGDDQLYGSFSFTGTIAPEESVTRKQLISLPLDIEGPHYVIVTTDGNNQLVEYNQEDNNTTVDNQFITITVPPQPDLVVSDITVPLETFSQQDIEIVWVVTNQGDEEATGTWNDLVYLSPDEQVGDDQLYGSFSFTGTIAPGESLTRKQLISLPLDIEGPHYVIVTTDGNNQLVEYNQEDNNATVSSQELTIALSPFPNLQVEEVIPPPTAFSGQETLVEWIVVNNGTGATSSNAWFDQVWLSHDQTLDSNDTFLGQAINPSFLNVGDSYSNSLTVTLPRGIENNYFFIVQTDARNQVLELHNEGDNNKVSGPTDLMLTPPPDLQVTSVNAPGQGFSGQSLILSWTVTNEGPGDTLENSWSDTIYLSANNILDDGDIFLGQQSHRGVLATGQSYQGTGNFALPVGVSGDFFIIVETDAHNQVFEHAFDSNNTGFDATPTKINLTPPPDLEVELVDAPAEATASRSLSINYRVTNFGATPTPNSSWQDSFYLSADNQFEPDSDLFLGQRTRFGALDIGEFYSETATFTLPHTLRGDFFVFAITDSADRVFELDNDNNLSLDPEAVTIVSRPADLVISTFTASSTAEAGKSLLVDWTVSNQGTGDTVARAWTDNIVASIDDVVGNSDDVILGRFSHRELLDAGDSYSRREVVTIPFSFAGDYNLFAVTDAGENVYEDSNETNNNSAPLRVTVTREIPDLQVTTINVPSTAQTATIIPLSWTVQNFGQGQTNSNFWYDEVFLSTDQKSRRQ